ncbi:MAG: phosphoribosylformylglycinamidine synthase subunit PurQ, partial [Anaerolineae bacterium]|nr:phosphoribosylformylglycinamidine synthase subunit PurQ [Anaerolineae bacterium]
GLLPGAMLQNASLRFICRWVNVRVESNRTPCTAGLQVGEVLRLPIAHHEGSYFVDAATLAAMEARQHRHHDRLCPARLDLRGPPSVPHHLIISQSYQS